MSPLWLAPVKTAGVLSDLQIAKSGQVPLQACQHCESTLSIVAPFSLHGFTWFSKRLCMSKADAGCLLGLS